MSSHADQITDVYLKGQTQTNQIISSRLPAPDFKKK